MSWSELAAIGCRVRPLSDLRPAPAWERSRFKATLSTTVAQLGFELRSLSAKNIVLELDLGERDIRLDGFPRSDARLGWQAVVLSFDSRFGPLRYATAEYDDWRDNLRAIALSMQALRAVDRYGVSKRGEQYTGWQALPVSTDPADAIQTEAQARQFLSKWDGDVRAALFATHPDQGGDPDEFRKVQRARELLGRGGSS